ncbi:putative HSPB1-associated protein 1-like [Apostichopus japonicus]|uniref:Putative HSPB1-associated protein 1-like n=1 Tax=Stichopus japonicus TaxID=307972 RepID=A0A2G8JRR6_STIJA|nr:putative HSPB1-associated protein 1-like [Apostichopus japonicus]
MAAPMNHNKEVTLAKNNLEKFKVSCGIDPEDANSPHVIRGVTETWPCISWSVSKLGELVGNKLVKFRIGPRRIRNGKVLWESLCSYEEAKLSDFEEWCSLSQGTLSQQNPLRKYDRDKFWCYADYKYMKDLFCDKQQIFEAIPWDSLGLNGYNGEQSTIWIGSSRAHTVCHQDAYGFNLVAQIQGRKKWYLFPPEQTDCLYPTRLPYEESSIFSEVNITEPDLAMHPRFQDSTPHVIVLEPGDVLYVPRHWWHYVECLDTSISVNCWVELLRQTHRGIRKTCKMAVLMCYKKQRERSSESITRICHKDVSIWTSPSSPQQNELNPDWLNPTETLTSYNTNLLYLENSLEILKQLNGQEKAKGEASDKWDGREAGISFKSHEPVERKLLMSADSSERTHFERWNATG